MVLVALFFTAGQSGAADSACALLTLADISTTTGLMVTNGAAGAPIPGVLGRCTWMGKGDSRVIVTLTDASHMQTTIAAQQKSGVELSGLGLKALGTRGAPVTGGGYIVSVLDAKGGFGVSILGKEGTQDRAIALAKVVASHR
jgi:hypothetical protein